MQARKKDMITAYVNAKYPHLNRAKRREIIKEAMKKKHAPKNS